MMKQDREQLIPQILAAARRPCLPIVPRYAVLCTDGEYRTSMPWGVKVVQPAQRKLLGYAYQAENGTTVGRLAQTAEELKVQHQASQDRQDADFRRELEKMPAKRFTAQVAYWLKETVTT